MTKTWKDLFQPVLKARPGTEVRPQQEQVGDAILLTMETGVPLFAEAATGTGKSFAALIPLISKVQGQKPVKRFRGVVSTSTNNLLKQYENDLKYLETIYPGFTWATLMGRANYLCFSAARTNVIGDVVLARKLATLESRPTSIGRGERRDVEKIVGELSDQEWGRLVGSSQGCYESSCTSEDCFSTKAREVALSANIVITNHSVLQADADARDGSAVGVGMLGEFEYLFVDEAHELEAVLIDGWTERLTEWELNKAGTTLLDGVVASMPYVPNSILDKKVSDAIDAVTSFIINACDFFQMVHRGQPWDDVEDSIKMHWVTCETDSDRALLNDYEVVGLEQVRDAKRTYNDALIHLKDMVKNHNDDMDSRTRKTVKKGLTAAKTLSEILGRIELAMQEKTGTIVEYGVPYAVVVNGRTKRTGEPTIDISVVPLDVSRLATDIWRGRRFALLSATLRDMTDGTYRYLAASLGIGQHNEITVAAPFDYANVQKVYVTTGQRPVVADIKGARYSFDEMVDLIHAARGRTLVLFTARAELEDAAHRLNQLAGAGEFNYPLLVQYKDSNKSKLAEMFRENTDSVLLGLRSFMTGVSFEGETVSQVILAKYPLPRYNAVCKQQVAWWRQRGFNDWYEREATSVFRQASGRLIRSTNCKGVVALLDQRAVQEGQNVRKTALKAVQSLGSVVTQDIDVVKEFLR